MGAHEPGSAFARIDLAEEPDFDLGGSSIKPTECVVEIDGERHELQPRVMQVLVALAKARPAVVSRDRLIEQCWDGRVVGDDALNRCILALRHLAQQAEPRAFAIETVPRIGHRLVELGAAKDARASRAWAGWPRRWWLPAAILALLVVAAAGFFLWRQQGAETEPAAIAVLPFRNLSAGDPYFAEGIGEEILAQLSREPAFRVAGSASSSQLPNGLDLRQVGRRLDVDYILEGSVRRQGNRVRVSADLVRASDGFRMWADSYDGKLDDIFAIQQRVGTAIAGALKRKLVRTPPLTGPLVTKGEAYSLYLSARTLIRTNNRRVGPTAVDLMRDAIRLDAGYAPAWATLAEATRFTGALHNYDGYIRALPKARSYAHRAVQLAPQLAEAHRALAHTYPIGDPQRNARLRKAADLDPNSAENLHGLAEALQSDGEWERALGVLQNANKLDPLWYRTTGLYAISTAEMGDRAEAEAIGRQGFPGNEIQQRVLFGRVAWIFGDFSEAARMWAFVARSNSPRWSHVAERTLYDVKRSVGIRSAPVEVVAGHWRVWMDAPPSPAVWQSRNRDALTAGVFRDPNHIAAKLMLNAGRASELVATYDSAIGLLGIRSREPLRVAQLEHAAIVVLALRQGGRAAEAERLLRDANALARSVMARGRVPFRFEATAGELLALAGRKDEAAAMLQRAFDRGWRHGNGADLPDIAKEPAVRSLHDHPVFERLRARLAAHYAREREETIRLQI